MYAIFFLGKEHGKPSSTSPHFVDGKRGKPFGLITGLTRWGHQVRPYIGSWSGIRPQNLIRANNDTHPLELTHRSQHHPLDILEKSIHNLSIIFETTRVRERSIEVDPYYMNETMESIVPSLVNQLTCLNSFGESLFPLVLIVPYG
jgi:hypothetical protein